MTAIIMFAAVGLAIVFIIQLLWIWNQNRLIKQMIKTGVILEVVLEKDTEKDPFSIEQVWSSFHGLYLPWYKRFNKPQPYISFEIKSENDQSKRKKEITFNFWVPQEYKSLIKTRILAIYPNSQIRELETDYMPNFDDKLRSVHTAELGLREDSAFSIKTFDDFESDPLTSIVSSLTELQNRELAVVQVMLRPMADSWRKKAARTLERYEKTGKMPHKSAEWTNGFRSLFTIFFTIIDHILTGLFFTKMPEIKVSGPAKSSVDTHKQKEMLAKVTRHPFSFQVRLVVASPDGEDSSKERIRNIIASFKELEGASNGFQREIILRKNITLKNMQSRFFSAVNNDDVLSTVEIASFCHLPNKDMMLPGLKKIQSKRLENPIDAATENAFARADFRGQTRLIGLDENARMRHIYISGMTGVGKSVLLENMIINDIENGRGVVVIDPHGELVDTIMEKISTTREDIFLLDPSDIENPFGMNLLEISTKDPIRREMEKILVIDSYITVMKRVFGASSIGANTDDLFRMSCSAILDHPEGGGLMEMLLMLTSEPFRARIIPFIKDPIVKNYWKDVFPALNTNKNFAVQNMNAPLNKIRRFIANGLVANIICQEKSTLNIADAMNSGAVILARFSRGDMGFENSALLGSMLISKVQIAAMQRVSIPMEYRVPTYLYVDEFQNFVGDSSGARTFAEILSEARKYKLGLVIAHQYIDQLMQGGDKFLLSAIFNNCGTTITFRVGMTDAKFFQDMYFDPDTEYGFKANDITNLGKGEVVVRLMTTTGIQSKPFPATTFMPVKPAPTANPELIRKRSIARICVPMKSVRDSIEKRMQMDNVGDMFN